MKKLIFVLAIIIGTSAFGIYGQTKNDDILKLLRVSGGQTGGSNDDRNNPAIQTTGSRHT